MLDKIVRRETPTSSFLFRQWETSEENAKNSKLHRPSTGLATYDNQSI